MLQRHQRNNLDQLIAFAREELQKDFVLLKDNASKSAHLSKTANQILEMYESLSYPLVGLQVIKENMTNIKHPHSLQVEMILDKAELFYLQSVKHDLGKLKIDQKIQHPSSEDIKQCIQQINWKLGFERESVLNQSQEIGDNIDLMKFFQGVRNFQNWEENLEKRTIEKLKKFANGTENQLTLKKGFIISKIQSSILNLQKKSKNQFLKKLQRIQKIQSKLSLFLSIGQKTLKQSFTLIKTVTCSKNLTAQLSSIFKKGSTKIQTMNLMSCFRNLVNLMKKSAKIYKVVEKISQKKILLYQFTFMRNINTHAPKKYEKIGRASEKMGRMCRRIAVKSIIRALSIKYYNLTRVVEKMYLNRLSSSLDSIVKNVAEKKAMKSAVSQKIKGKVLLSIQRRENKPVNIRKAFLNWYLKSHEQNYSKKIYNIWLNGSISKFTFLMRIKNTINEGRRQKVRQELKYFLMVFMQNINGYYKYCQKGFINKWLEWHRYCKKLMNLINLLAAKTKKIDDNIERQAFRSVVDTSKKVTYLQSYFRKRIQRMQSNFSSSFNIWKMLPNIKKAKGQVKLLTYLRSKLAETLMGEKQSFEIFRHYKVEGKQKKVRFLVKMFAKDSVYLSSFFNYWRRNSMERKILEQHWVASSNVEKTNALKMISMKRNHLINQTVRQAVLKLILTSKFRKRRSQKLAKVLADLIDDSYSANQKQCFSQFKIQYEEGKAKKQRLVLNLVAANKQKQSKVLQVWNAGAQVKKSAEREKKLQDCFSKANQALKQNLSSVINSRFVLLYLKKFYNNYRRNITCSIESLHNLPPRIKKDKKKSMVEFADRLILQLNKQKSKVYQAFKFNQTQAQYKKKKVVHNMVAKWTTCLKSKLNLYRQNILSIKKGERSKRIIQLFESCNQKSQLALSLMFLSESMKAKKSMAFNKLNKRLQDRLRQSLKLWQSTSKSLTYLSYISLQKKRRVLGELQKINQRTSTIEAKKCVSYFLRNSKIIQLQTNFLRKLCDSQAGKVSKALMIWKGLPQPKNKQLIIKASTFERNLNHYAAKIIRTALNKFKDDLYFGNDKKKLAIRTLVARSCSGIEKYFAIWKKNNKLTLLFRQCHRLESIMGTILQVQQKNYISLTDKARVKNIHYSFDKIIQWWEKRARRAFKKWMNNIQSTKKMEHKKNKCLQTLSVLFQKAEKSKIQKVLLNLKKKIILRNILKRTFIHNKANNIHKAFLAIQKLPDFRKINLKKTKLQTVLKFTHLLENEIRNDKIKVLQIFRDIKYTGNFRKLKSCQSYLKDRISQVHKILNLWLNMARADKKQKKQNAVQSLFEFTWQISQSNYSQILQSIKSTQLKRKCIEKLCNAMQIKKKGFFNIWVSKVKEIRINKFLDDTKKKNILEKINKLIFGTSQENVKKTVRNFYLNFKISSVQVKFIQRLLQTKSGKVLEAFNKWKEIPNQNLMQKYKKGQKFYFKLESLVKYKISEVHSCFGKNSEEGSSLKKQAVLQLLQITSSGIRRYYSRWTRITKRDHTLKQAYSMMHSFDAMQHCLAESMKIVFQNERTSRIKTWAIEKLILQTKDNTATYFKKWRDISRQIKVAQQFEKAEKSTALKLFANIIGGTESTQIKQILEKFHKNAAISKISTNFLNRLLKTKSGKVVQLFEVWKSIPDAKVANKKKKAIKFESNLHKLSSKFLRVGFEPFKSSSHQANNKKRLCIEKLIRASMGEEKKKFLLWREIIKEQKMLTHTHLFDSLFQKMNEKISQSIGIMIKRASSEIESKKNLCRKLISNSNFVQHHSYLIWKQALQVDNLKIQKTESKVFSYLSNMINVNQKIQSRKLIQIVSSFKRKFDFRIKLVEGIKKEQKNKQAILFFNKLSLFTQEKVGLFFYEVLKNQKEMTFLNKNRNIEKSLENLNLILRDNFKILISSNKQTVIVEKALNKIFENFKVSTQRAFNLWRQYKNILNLQIKISSEKKKNVLQILGRCLQSQQKIKVPYVISKFERNYKSIKYRKQMLTKILQCKAGKVPLAFMIWKSLPNPNAKKLKLKAMKFEVSLSKLLNKNLKSSYQKFKDETQQGQNKKKNAVRKLILVTMSDSNRYFNKWRKSTAQAKITGKLAALTRFFDNAIQICNSNFKMFQKAQQSKQQKRKGLEKLVFNTRMNLLWALNAWRVTIKDQKCYKIQKTMQKFELGNVNLLALKEGFAKIKSKAEKQALRAYINSLWKWKMSNVEANYYSKFIKIFKESEELLILSNCLNRKHYQNLHCAFRKIMVQGSDRYQRKYRIVEKYFMRKVSNYFQRFKINACFEEIKTWRNMYKSTIKAKRMTDLIEKIARKQVYISYYEIQSKERQSVKGTKIIEKLNNFIILLKRDGFNQICRQASSNNCNRIARILQKIVSRIRAESLLQILVQLRIQRMSEAILKTVKKGSTRFALMKIQSKALLKSKARFAIILMSCINKQNDYLRINSVLKIFSKNSQLLSSLSKILNLLDLKHKQNLQAFYRILHQGLEKKILLTRFRKGMMIKKILDQSDAKVLRRIFGLLKKRQNVWIMDSVKKFVIRSNLKSSLAVSLWRLQMFQMRANEKGSQ